MNEFLNTAIEASIKAGLAILEVYQSENFEVRLKTDQSPLTMADKKAHNVIVGFLKKTGLPILSEEGKNIPYETRKNWNKFWLVDPLDGTKEFIKRNGEFTVNIALIENEKPIAGVVYVPVTDTLLFGTNDKGAFRVEGALEKATNLHEQDWISLADKIPDDLASEKWRVVASRSHMSLETEDFIESMMADHPEIEIVSKGSSLKLCLVAEGKADIYPRFGLTSEWDTAAGHAIITASGGRVVLAADENIELTYNKENILNPYFIAKRN